jgi:hypothetical protein
MHKLEIPWRSRNKLAENFIGEMHIIMVTYLKLGMTMQNKILKKPHKTEM